jgi:hypothetical protein
VTGLVGWWPLHENSGRTRDLSGGGMHSVNQNKIVKGISGKGGLTCYGFNGSDSRVKLSDFRPARFNNMGRGTISIWFRADTKTNGSSAHFEDQLWGARRDEVAAGFGSEGEVRFNLYGPDNTHHNVGTKTIPSTDQWYHFAATFGSTDGMQVYLNGEFENSNSYTKPSRSKDTSTDNMHIGNVDPNWAESGFDGQLCDFRVYNRVLSPQEIQALYEWGNGEYASPPNDRTDSSAVSRWAFDGDVKDSWGNNDGTDNTSLGYSSDAIRGKAKKFDGSDDYVEIDADQSHNVSDDLTVTAWFRSNEISSSRQAIVQKWSGSYTDQYLLRLKDGDIQFYINDGGTVGPARTSYTEKEWYFVAGVYDSSKGLKLFKNGIRRNLYSYSGGIDNVNDKLGLGGDSGQNAQFNGQIDDVRIYSRALSPSEVFELYQWGTRGRDMRKLTVNKR